MWLGRGASYGGISESTVIHFDGTHKEKETLTLKLKKECKNVSFLKKRFTSYTK